MKEKKNRIKNMDILRKVERGKNKVGRVKMWILQMDRQIFDVRKEVLIEIKITNLFYCT